MAMQKIKDAGSYVKATVQAEIPTTKTKPKLYVGLDEVRSGKAKLAPSKNLKLERFKIEIPPDIDITALAYERNKY